MIGQLLDKRYELIRVLASGGFGQTYVAKDKRLPGEPICVVKQLRPGTGDPQVLATIHRLFGKEAETLQKLGRYDRIPQLFAYFEEGQEFYLVQEYISGHPLYEELAPGKTWPEDQIVAFLKDILTTLTFIHGHGVIHRDIKPANIIRRDTDSKLVLIDFGAVKELTTMVGKEQPTVGIGTPAYMPIEQLKGYPQFNSDIYATGAIAVQAATGLSAAEISTALDPNHPAAGTLNWRNNAKISPHLADVIGKMVQPGYQRRYQSAGEVLADLGPSATNPGGGVTPPPPPPPPKRLGRVLLWAAGGASVVVAAIGIGIWNYIPQSFMVTGQQALQSGDYKRAESEFDTAIWYNSKWSKAYVARGYARSRLGKLTQAEADDTKAIELDSRNREAYKDRSAIRLLLKNGNGAVEDSTKAIAIDPNYSAAYQNRGNAYYGLKKYKEAIDDETHALQLEPKAANAYTTRGLARKGLGDEAGALDDYSQALAINPNEASTYADRGNLYIGRNDYTKALADYNKAIQIDPRNGQFYLARAQINAATKDLKAVVADLQNATQYCLAQGYTGCYNDARYWLQKFELAK